MQHALSAAGSRVSIVWRSLPQALAWRQHSHTISAAVAQSGQWPESEFSAKARAQQRQAEPIRVSSWTLAGQMAWSGKWDNYNYPWDSWDTSGARSGSSWSWDQTEYTSVIKQSRWGPDSKREGWENASTIGGPFKGRDALTVEERLWATREVGEAVEQSARFRFQVTVQVIISGHFSDRSFG